MINKIEEMEERIHTSQDGSHEFMAMWSGWSHFKTTEQYNSYF